MKISFQTRTGRPAYHIDYFYRFTIAATGDSIEDLLIPETAFDFFYTQTGEIGLQTIDQTIRLPAQSLRTLHTQTHQLYYKTPLDLYGVRLRLDFIPSFWRGEMESNRFLPADHLSLNFAEPLKSLDHFAERVINGLDQWRSTQANPKPPLDSPANLKHYSERHRRRLFKKRYGISQKEMGSIKKMHTFLNQSCDFSGGHPRIIDHLEVDSFYDQPHLSRTFKKLTGLSLLEYFETESLLQENILAVSYKEMSRQPLKIEV